VGVPVKLGKNGIEEIIKIELNAEERAMLDISINDVRANVEKLKDKVPA
jgi:malate dehydrogenase